MINSAAQPSTNVTSKGKRNAVMILGIIEMILCIFCFSAGIAEIVMGSEKFACYEYTYSHTTYEYCFYYFSIGQGIWCSIFPFIASIFGITAGKYGTLKQARLLNGYSITGAIFMATLGAMELTYSLLGFYDYYNYHYYYDTDATNTYYSLQCAMASIAILNMILLIASAGVSCGLGGCCCSTQGQNTVIVSYANPANQPIYSVNPGMQAYPHQGMMTNPSQLQPTSSSHYTNLAFYGQPEMMQREPTQTQMVQPPTAPGQMMLQNPNSQTVEQNLALPQQIEPQEETC